MKRKGFILSIALALVFCVSGLASADVFNFNYSGVGVTASGQLSADLVSPGVYHITGITGTRNGDAITSFVSGGPSGFSYGDGTTLDNVLLIPSNPAFLSSTNHSGFVFGTSAGQFNPYYDTTSGNYYEYKLYTSNSGGSPGIEITFNASPVPLPAALLLFGPGLAGLAMVRRRIKG